ncbi:hypothetical protein [Ralstonia solanacearum]|uniref:hypothetical protein n=1 Tax=Ralstonia solanacearum TaxID=305 RepID=UPI0012DAD538|nr:hypothetical protein [Ralstonia solanacearum]
MQLPFLVRGETRATSSSAKSADRMSVYASPQVMGYWSRSKTIAEITGPLLYASSLAVLGFERHLDQRQGDWLARSFCLAGYPKASHRSQRYDLVIKVAARKVRRLV